MLQISMHIVLLAMNNGRSCYCETRHCKAAHLNSSVNCQNLPQHCLTGVMLCWHTCKLVQST